MRIVCMLLISLSGFSRPVFAEGVVGLKTSRQLFASFSALTGVEESDLDIRKIYSQQKERLVNHGTLDEINTAVVYSTLVVADAYCKKWLQLEAERPINARQVHQNIDFNSSVTNLSEEQMQMLVRRYGELFWQRVPTAEEASALHQVLKRAIALQTTAPSTIAGALRPLCITTTSSLAFLTN